MSHLAQHLRTTLSGLLLASAALSLHAQDITGAGATFPAPAYAKWAEVFAREKSIRVNYQPIGSSGGIRQIDGRTVDFGATDAPLQDDELRRKGQIQFPTLIGGVIPVVNLRGIAPGQLKLSGQVLGDIYLGKITRWNDPAIQTLNPQLSLPASSIEPVYRSDGSGTTFIFTNYLNKVNNQWKAKVGEGTSVGWPRGTGGKGNLGVAAMVTRIPNSIGYVEYAYVRQARMNYALVSNAAGAFVEPGTEAFRAASSGIDWSASNSQMLTNQASPKAWPITGATFILVYAKPQDPAKTSQVLRFFHWGITEGAAMATELGYAPLPPEVLESIERLWGQVSDASGQPVAFK